MARWRIALLMWLPLVAMAAKPVTSLPFGTSAWVDVDSAGRARVVEMGKVSRLGDVPELASAAQAVSDRLRERIETWEFEPATRDGVAVSSRTHVYVSLEGMDDGAGGLAVRIRAATTGAELKDRNLGGLVRAGMGAGEEGIVVVDLAYDANGKVVATKVHESMAFERGRFHGEASRDLRWGIVAAARKWVFVPETVDGRPLAGGGRVPVQFCLSDECSAARTGGEDVAGSRFVALDPAVKLRTAVDGTLL